MNEVIDKLKWYYNRFQAMSPKEIPYRFEQKYKNIHYKKIFNKRLPIYKHENIRYSLNTIKKNLEKIVYVEHMKYASDNTNYNIFNETISLNDEILWHKSTVSTWTKEKYSRSYNFSNADEIGEIRFTWEMNRHQFLPLMALEYKTNGDVKLYQQIRNHFYNWHENNNFLNGVNWSSSMEIAIRAYQWLILLSILKDEIDEEFANDLITSIIISTEYIIDNLSKHSSANNHLIVEVAICSIIGWVVYPLKKQNWFLLGYEVLQKEIINQTYPDGVNKEQAVHYHAFVLDMFLQYNMFLSKISKEPINVELVKNMVIFIGYLYQGGEMIEFGDSDDAKIICLDPNINYYKYILQLASVIYKINFLNETTNISTQVSMLTGKVEIDLSESENYQYDDFKIFNEGGYSFINYPGFFIGFDTGELGFGNLAAHGHADALSIVLNYKKKKVFVDPGTFIYNTDRELRDLFRSTVSHNTLLYENKNQSEIKGSFLWGNKAKTTLYKEERTNEYILLEAKHDGYYPSFHVRKIIYFIKLEAFVIIDQFEGDAEVHFTLAPELILNIKDQNNILLNNGLKIVSNKPMKVIEKVYSDKFLSKQITNGISISNNFNKHSKVYTLISSKNISLDNQNNMIIDGDIVSLNL
ncbi:alginate lyase family protein [Gottfriedia acidiceleris]|uniref:alginate lyase family protein n=1 Tax=Gottfriedia acidiceleris TaxID=371036 RepID=UPI002FFE561E